MAQSKIEWTDTTWNPVTGCDKVSPGCKHCYAETRGSLTVCGNWQEDGASSPCVFSNNPIEEEPDGQYIATADGRQAGRRDGGL